MTGVRKNPINETIDPEILPNLRPNQENLLSAGLYNVGYLNEGSEIRYLPPLPFNSTPTSLDPTRVGPIAPPSDKPYFGLIRGASVTPCRGITGLVRQTAPLSRTTNTRNPKSIFITPTLYSNTYAQRTNNNLVTQAAASFPQSPVQYDVKINEPTTLITEPQIAEKREKIINYITSLESLPELERDANYRYNLQRAKDVLDVYVPPILPGEHIVASNRKNGLTISVLNYRVLNADRRPLADLVVEGVQSIRPQTRLRLNPPYARWIGGVDERLTLLLNRCTKARLDTFKDLNFPDSGRTKL